MSVGTTCCRAYQAPFPSGWWWIHSRFCPQSPGVKIRKVGEARPTAPDESSPKVRPIPVESPSADADAWGEFWGEL